MNKVRLIFSKTGRAKYISHLDLMRTFQRIFRRAGIDLRHSEGFNPHPYLTFALPLSVGAESVCELVDSELISDISMEQLPTLLNTSSPEGIEILKAYTPQTKYADIKWLEVKGRLTYDQGVSDAVNALTALFESKSLIISKKTKRGIGDFDIIPALDKINFENANETEIELRAIVSAQNPTMNPDNLITAIETHQPEYKPDFASFTRLEIFDQDHRIFR